MKALALACAALVVAGASIAAAANSSPKAQPITVPAFGPRFKQTRERADILFGRRNGSYPLPNFRVSLFQTAAEAAPADKTPTHEPVGSDEALLEEAVAVLKKVRGGIATHEGVAYVTVGTTRYREGAALPVPLRSGTIELRIVRISGQSVTVRLNQLEKTFRF